MPVNPYFHSGVPMGRRSEQSLYEDLIIETLKIYGHETYYVPRKKFNQDQILNEDPLQTYEHFYPLEMYLENVQGFEGEGELLSKFGVELRDTATFIVSRRRWQQMVGEYGQTILPRPSEGDIIYFPLTKSYFEIRKVIGNEPFYQAGALYVYKLVCELMQYSMERFDTGNTDIDEFADTVTDAQTTAGYEFQLETGDRFLNENSEFMLLESYRPDNFTLEGQTTVVSQNASFDTDIEDILDFTERNPFGEVARA
jgi:hypothetical protein